MRIPRNPNRARTARVVTVALLAIAMLSLGVAAGFATASKPSPHKSRNPANPTAAASARAIELAIGRAVKSAKSAATHASAARGGQGIIVRRFTIGASLDGAYAFITSLEVKALRHAKKRNDGGLVNFRLQVDRVTRASGERTRVLDKLDRYPITVFARGGQVAMQAFRWSDVEKADFNGSGSVKALLTTYSGPEDAASIGATASEQVKLDEVDGCARVGLLVGLTETGSQLLAQLDGKCGKDSLPQQSATIATRDPDGSVHTIAPAAFSSIGQSATSASGGGSVLYADPNGTALSAQSRAGGAARTLWSPAARLAAIGADGTVALLGAQVPIPGREQWDDRTGMPRHNSTKSPFVIFPGGDVDNPVLIAASRKSIVDLRFCGNNLYVLNGDPKFLSGDEYDVASDFLVSLFFNGIADTPLDIQLYNSQGQFQRSLAKTKRTVLASTGCDNDRLLYATVSSAFVTPHVNEVAP